MAYKKRSQSQWNLLYNNTSHINFLWRESQRIHYYTSRMRGFLKDFASFVSQIECPPVKGEGTLKSNSLELACSYSYPLYPLGLVRVTAQLLLDNNQASWVSPSSLSWSQSSNHTRTVLQTHNSHTYRQNWISSTPYIPINVSMHHPTTQPVGPGAYI